MNFKDQLLESFLCEADTPWPKNCLEVFKNEIYLKYYQYFQPPSNFGMMEIYKFEYPEITFKCFRTNPRASSIKITITLTIRGCDIEVTKVEFRGYK